MSFLSLPFNDLHSLPPDLFTRLTRLTELYLNRNNISSLDGDIFDSLSRLETLLLEANSLTTLPDGIFDNLTMMQDLNLDGNELASLPVSIFQNNAALETLRLFNNNLRALPARIFQPLDLVAELCLGLNPGITIFVPTAVVRAPTRVATGATATLDAGASGGPWGTNVTYAWTQTGGTTVTLTGADTAAPSFTGPAAAGTLTFSVKVTGAGGEEACAARTDTVTVTVQVETVPVGSPCAGSHQGGLRLAGVNRAMPDREGRLEICYDDGDAKTPGWGVICDDYWTDVEADVACRQLGFLGAVDNGARVRDEQGRSLPPLYFGAPDEGVPMWLDNVNCVGNETSLLDCPRRRGGQSAGTGNLPVGKHNCRPSEAVGVRCTMTPQPSHVTGPSAVLTQAQVTATPTYVGRDDEDLDAIDVVLRFDAPVTVDTAGGTPSIFLRTGSDRFAREKVRYLAGSGSTRLLFQYAIPKPFGSPGPVRVVGNSLHAQGGTMRYAETGLDVALAHGGAAVPPFIVSAPVVALIDADDDDSFGDGDRVEVTVTFNEPVDVTTTGGTPSVGLSPGLLQTPLPASYVSGSGSTALVFSYTKAAADTETETYVVAQLALNDGSIKSTATDADALLSSAYYVFISTDFTTANQRAAPSVQGAPALSEAGADGFWTAGETVEVRVTFSEPVSVNTADGTPTIGLLLGGTEARSAEYARGSGTAELVFGYTLAEGEGPHNAMLVPGDSLALNGGAIVSAADSTVAADLTHNGTGKVGLPAEPVSARATTRGAADGPTASFSDVPATHDGETPFTVKLSFDEEPALSYKTVEDSLLEVNCATVSCGTVTKASRVTQGSDSEWKVTVEPSQGYDITLKLPVRACGKTGAVCVDGRPLAEAASVTIPGEALTATLTGPAEHDGSESFTVRLTFSMEPDVSYKTVSDTMFTVTGGTITGAKRVKAPHDLEFDITVEPGGYEAVSLKLASPLPACGTSRARCAPRPGGRSRGP